jgi:hypothetical protein
MQHSDKNREQLNNENGKKKKNINQTGTVSMNRADDVALTMITCDASGVFWIRGLQHIISSI